MHGSTEMEEDTIDLREIFSLLWRNALPILGTTVFCAVVGLLVSIFLLKPIYQADATMIVNTRQDQTAVITNDQITSAQKLVDTYSIIVTSRTVLQPVMDNLQLDMEYEEFVENISVTPVNATQVMQVSVKDRDPEQALAIVTEIIRIAPDIIIDTVEAGSVKTVSQPFVDPENPVFPNKFLNVIVSALAGLVLSVLFVIVHDMFDNTFKSEQDMQRELGVPVLGIIPTIESCRKGGQY